MKRALLIVAAATVLTAQSWFSDDTTYDAKTWADMKALNKQLSTLSRGNSSSTDYKVSIWGDGTVWVTIKRDGTDFVGKGLSPWDAAEDLIKKTGFMRDGLEKVLRPGS